MNGKGRLLAGLVTGFVLAAGTALGLRRTHALDELHINDVRDNARNRMHATVDPMISRLTGGGWR